MSKKVDPLWLRSWRMSKKRVHLEVRDPERNLAVVKVYHGKDHTLHIILQEEG